MSNTLLVGETYYVATTNGNNTSSLTWAMSGKTGGGATPMQMAGMQLSINAIPFDQVALLQSVARGFSSFHLGGCHFALADGSVHFVNQSGDLPTLQKLSVRNDGGGWEGNL